MLCNLAMCQNTPGFGNFISRDLYGKIIQISIQARELAMIYKEQGNSGGFANYRVLYYESMQVILHFISSCKEEQDFMKLVQDKIVIEIIVQSL